VNNACKIANQDMLAEYTARNQIALDTLVNKHKVDLRQLPNDVLDTLKNLSKQVVSEVAAKDAISKKVFNSFEVFSKKVSKWSAVSEKAYLNVR